MLARQFGEVTVRGLPVEFLGALARFGKPAGRRGGDEDLADPVQRRYSQLRLVRLVGGLQFGIAGVVLGHRAHRLQVGTQDDLPRRRIDQRLHPRPLLPILGAGLFVERLLREPRTHPAFQRVAVLAQLRAGFRRHLGQQRLQFVRRHLQGTEAGHRRLRGGAGRWLDKRGLGLARATVLALATAGENGKRERQDAATKCRPHRLRPRHRRVDRHPAPCPVAPRPGGCSRAGRR